jgi:hypothetical protein
VDTFPNQWINYGAVYVDDASATVWAIVEQDGYVYASVGGQYPEQIKNGLTSDNFNLYESWYNKVFATKGQNVSITLTQLYGQTSYSIYLVAENNADVVDIMADKDVVSVSGTTLKSVYSLPA